MVIKIIKEPISLDQLRKIAQDQFGDFVKAVVDVEREVMAIGGELHADEEVWLTENEGSKRQDTWGINLYWERSGDDLIEFDSMINLKPALGNRSRGVENSQTREKIKSIVKKLISK